MKKGRIAATAIGVGLTLSLVWYARCYSGDPSKVEQVITEFERFHGPEWAQIDPLLLGGDIVTAEVIRRVDDQRIGKRLYAVLYLGNRKAREAVPTLTRVVNSASEVAMIRCAALQSLHATDINAARKVAQEIVGEHGNASTLPSPRACLPFLATLMVRQEDERVRELGGYFERTRWDAAIGRDTAR